ncbi:MAG: hypothetical protein BMS9Abin02_1644 [Anaerolineae bacterium]|nr:MAG: hypothetical protein BMS9Abin02_1644 [Anaerolineae bacterium]
MQAGNKRLHRGVLLNVNVLVLDSAPEPFNEDDVKDAPTTVHTEQFRVILMCAVLAVSGCCIGPVLARCGLLATETCLTYTQITKALKMALAHRLPRPG